MTSSITETSGFHKFQTTNITPQKLTSWSLSSMAVAPRRWRFWNCITKYGAIKLHY